MKNNHVGRPTNEEVATRKRKQLMKVLLPSSLIAIVAIMIIGNSGLKGLRGNEVFKKTYTVKNEYVCEDGWTIDGDKCYQETKNSTQIDAYLLGDENNDDVATLADYSIIKNIINSGDELDNIQKAVFDLNQDGIVNEQDVSSYDTSTSGAYILDIKYVCPYDKEEETQADGEKIITTTTYTLEDKKKCLAETTIRKEKNAELVDENEDADDSITDEDSDIIIIDDEADGDVKIANDKSASARRRTVKKTPALCKKYKKGVFSKEPCPNNAILYWSKKKKVDKRDFIYPYNQKGQSLGAWPKHWSSYPNNITIHRKYHKYYIWPITPKNRKYTYVYNHVGMDIVSKFGTPVYSPVDGTLVYSEWGHTVNKGFDETSYSITIKPNKTVKYKKVKINEIFLTHLSGIRYRCNSIKNCKRKVKKGELIGYSGTAAGDSYKVAWAPHLHLTYYNSSNYNKGLLTKKLEKFYKIKNKTKREAGR